MTPLMDIDGLPHAWTLVVSTSSVHLFVNGGLILSADAKLTGSPTLNTGKNALGLNNLAIGLKPRVALNYHDAVGLERQNQALSDGNAILKQNVRDAMGHSIVTTKFAPARFGKVGQSTPLLVYSGSFVDVSGFLGNLDGTGEMNGDVSEYYNGTNLRISG